jgi:hypothetical protein
MKLLRLKNGNSTNRKFNERVLLLIPLVLVCFGLSSVALGVTPFPDGGYPGANTAEGDFALQNLSTGNNNTALGASALAFTTSGNDNTAVGNFALNSNTADNNTATGSQALADNTIGTANTAMGFLALGLNTNGHDNTAIGYQALTNNTGPGVASLAVNGTNNTATGSQALYSNTEGHDNTAMGYQALFNNTEAPSHVQFRGSFNTAVGSQALYNNKYSGANTAMGYQALYNNTFDVTSFGGNTAIGYQALYNNITGSNNIALGPAAGDNLTTGDNNIDIGNEGMAAETNTTRIGTQGTQTKTFMAGIIGAPIAGPTVHISGTGQLGIGPPSSVRFKDEIKPMDKASEAILALKPVMFRYKKELDPQGIAQFGLVAEEVEKINPDLVDRDAQGKVYTVRYEAVNAMLLNEFLKEHRKVEEQADTIAQLKSGMEALAATVKEQASQIQKVSDQLELTKPAPRTVSNNQ